MHDFVPELDFDAEDLSVDTFSLVDEGLTIQSLTATAEAPARSCGCAPSYAVCIF